MGTKKGLRAQEQQAQQGNELSGASAGHREPEPARHSVETPEPAESSSAIGQTNNTDSDDIENFEDDTDADVDEENDLA